jgi:ADP-ribosylglycohydrolase
VIWDLQDHNMLYHELRQRRETGYQVDHIAALIPDQPPVHKVVSPLIDPAQYETIWRMFESLPEPTGFRYQEPSDLADIRRLRSSGPRRISHNLSSAALHDRIYGAWLGRCAGCTLGKPVEGWPREKIFRYLDAASAYPLHSYFPVIDPFPPDLALHDNWRETSLGHVHYMPRDDDIDYTILGLHILEQHGRDFETQDVGAEWLLNLPYARTYTAEIVAYRNLIMELKPPQTASYRNPYREWLGAQIRADAWGYANPGAPERAAEYAFRDASLSHVGNGIYGAMWAAAAIAAAFVTSDLREIIHIANSEIPASCRLTEAVNRAVGAADRFATWEDAWDHLMITLHYGEYHPIHVINNTLLIVLGLLYGEGDFGRSICIAVMGGFDTDCTGATLGSILGAQAGAANLPREWTDPLGDMTKSAVFGYDNSRISDLARRTARIATDSSSRTGG